MPAGSSTLRLQAGPAGSRLLLLGGPPFGEPIVMWWNFVGRTPRGGRRLPGRVAGAARRPAYDDGRFGIPIGNEMAPIPAPPLPNARLKERR